KNPLIIDSKEPTGDYIEFIKSEARYSRLIQSFPERAEKLFTEAQRISREKYEHLKRLAELYKVE
ncbi:MAG TPA: hypothetical protein PLZ27_07200, partial [Bacillota bacterium]|nr:hypothetical protein [Bacillota bacterium]